MAQLYDPNDPIVEMIKGRNPDATDVEVLILLHEWWALYGQGFADLGSIALVARASLDRHSPDVIATLMLKTLVDAGVNSMANIVFAALDEVNARVHAVLEGETVEEPALRELLDYLIKLGRVEW